jgi:16S rRNA (cytidine1402-2'-O)-methyltransferase
VALARQVGIRVVPVPGASSVTALMSVAGITTESQQATGFVFAGFLPTKASERATAIQTLATEHRAIVLLEAPHRIEAVAQALAVLQDRPVTMGRELTKQFEELATQAASQLSAWLAADANRLRGEYTLVIHPLQPTDETAPDDRVLRLLMAELPLKTAVKLCAEITGESRNTLYDRALALKAQASVTPD